MAEEEQEYVDNDRVYWGNFDHYSEEFGDEVIERYRSHQRVIHESGYADRMAKSWCQYNSRDPDGNYDTSEINYSGEKGENVEAFINEYRALIRAKLAAVVSDPISFKALALNDNSSAMKSSQKAQYVLKFYQTKGGMSEAVKSLAETAMVMAASWVSCTWDLTQGPESTVDPETGDVVYGGEIAYNVFHPFQTAYDRSCANVANPPWIILRKKVNKFELAKQYPESAEQILDGSTHTQMEPFEFDKLFFETDSDYIWVFQVFFKPSLLTPNGRMSLVLDDGHVVFDGVSSYSRVPVFMLAPSITIGDSNLPYGNEHDALLPIGLMQAAYTALASSHDACVPVLWTSESVEYGQLGNFSHIKGGDKKPETLHLYKPSEHSYSWLRELRGTTERIAQVNPAMLGTPAASSSGSKTAFQASTGLTLLKPFTNELRFLMEQLATMTIEVLRTHMPEERTVAITGIRGSSETVKFKKADLHPIQSVVVKASDPFLDSPEGRAHVADIGAQKNWFSTPDEYVAAYTTGVESIMTSDNTDAYILIKRENEQIQEALESVPSEVRAEANELIKYTSLEQDVAPQIAKLLEPYIDVNALPVVVETDKHREHIDHHSVMYFEDSVRKDPLAKHLLNSHILQHVLALTPGSNSFNQQMLMLTGQQPLPMANPHTGQPEATPDMQPPNAEGVPQAPQGSAPKQPGLTNIPMGAAVAGRPPELPSPPSNPATGKAAPSESLNNAPVPSGARKG